MDIHLKCILIRFIQNAPQKRKLILKPLYKTIAEVELNGDFRNTSVLNLEDIQKGISMVPEVLKKVTLGETTSVPPIIDCTNVQIPS